jgi:hypothetical protein
VETTDSVDATQNSSGSTKRGADVLGNMFNIIMLNFNYAIIVTPVAGSSSLSDCFMTTTSKNSTSFSDVGIYIFNLIFLFIALSSEQSEFGKRVIGQLAAQEETNKIMIGVLSGLQQSVEMFANKFKSEAPRLETPRLETPRFEALQRNLSTAPAERFLGNISADTNNYVGIIGKFTPLNHQNRVTELFLDQYQKSRESMEAVKAENNLLSSLAKIQQLAYHM